MENKLYDALARVLLAGAEDQFGNRIPSPLANALNEWAYNKDNIKKVSDLVAKKIKIDELVEAIAGNIKSSFSTWSGDDAKKE